MPKKTIEIKSCKECPHFREERDYTADSFETCFRWYCKKLEKNVRRYVDWNDKREEFIPEECPL